MNFRGLQSIVLTTLVVVASAVTAGEAVDKAVRDKIVATLDGADSRLQVGEVQTSEVPGLFEVQLGNGTLVYTTESGNYFIVGDLYEVSPDGYANLTEKRRDVARAEKMSKVAVKDMIVFSPQGKPRSYITVFTDVTCYYCQKLHQEVPELTKNGVEVRYLGYPRAGIGSDAYNQLVSAWCADNPQDTLTRLKNKESVPTKSCPENPIAGQYQLGMDMGVRGTPAILTPDGRLIPGYQSAAELMVTLGLN